VMDVTFNFILLMLAGVAFVMAILVWLRHRMPGSSVGGFVVDLGCIWSLTYLLQIVSETPADVELWYSIQTAFSFLVPALYMVYLARYFELDEKAIKKYIPLVVPSLVFAGLAVTNGRHSLMWSNSVILLNNQMSVEHSVLGIAAILHIYVVVVAATYFLVHMILSKRKVYKIRAVTFLLAIAIFATTYALSLLGYFPNQRNMTPLIFNLLSSVIVLVNPENLYKTDVLPLAYESIIGEMNDAAIIADHEYKVIWLNDAAKRLTGFSAVRFLDMKLWDILPDIFYVKSRRIIEEKTGIEYKDGVYDLRIMSLSDDWSQERVRIFVIRDMTDVLEYSKRLERIVEEKTKELRDAERLVIIGETTLMVGHDLRNPLQVLKGLSYGLKKKHADRPGAMEVFDKIDKSIFYMDKIVSDLQAFGKKKDPDARLYPLRGLVNNALTQIEVPGDIEMVMEFPDDFMVAVDWYMIQRLFINLLLNAVQAMPDGGKLFINANRIDDDNVIIIGDTGVGIPKENLENLFKPLYTTKAKGTGLGLAVCKKIVDAHNGSIKVESKEGKGTIFTITLPTFTSDTAPENPLLDMVVEKSS
jgi:PAS domain S-box-containing protein